ncbi:MAG: efflux RND transporter periplasmic adaptor subunit [Desulfobacterota bacterium]|nr:efflux RND transporter periplasmic adaptor subunit [Thermodesulfobacteriota bacterium]
MKKFVAYGIPVLILLAGILAMLFFASFRQPPPKKQPETPVKVVEAEKVRLADIPAEITAYGRIISAQPVVLTSEVTGMLESGEVPFKPGQRFRKGDLLVKVDTRQILLDINTTKSELLTALANVLPEIKVDFPGAFGVWQDYFNRCTFDRPLPDLPAAANQQIKLYLARFNVYKLYFTIRDLEIMYEKHFFRAPFDGSIAAADLRIGANVRPGTKIGEIINLEALEAELPVPADDIQWIDREQPVRLTSPEIAGLWSGRISRIGTTVDVKTQTVQVYVGVDHRMDDGLHDGVFIHATIAGRTIPAAVVVPRRALYEEQFVYVIRNGLLDYRRVSVARKNPDTVIVNDGLVDGELLVTQLLQGVSAGMHARPRNLPPEGNMP